MKKMILAVMAGLMLGIGCLTAPSYAAVPQVVPYQGQLKDAAGTPVNGVVNITFSLYTASSGGVAIWTETQAGVSITKGLFKVDLGADPLNRFTPGPGGTFDTPVYLGVTIGTDPEMSPRTPLNSAPFALHADDADTVGGAPVSQLDQSAHVLDTTNPHGVTAAQTGAATPADIAAHAANASAHHVKTTSFVDLTDVTTDAQIPALIARDTEVTNAVNAHAVNASAHHARYTNAEAVAAVGASGNYVQKAGDTMTGALNLPSNGLLVGPLLTPELAVSGGKVGVGTASPAGDLDVLGQSGVLFSGTFNAAGTTPLPATGAGTRMMWFPELAAFRVGSANATEWDKTNIGQYSVAMGLATTASGSNSTAMGVGTTASGASSTAMGSNPTASGASSTAMGSVTTASAFASTAMGANTTASGQYSTAMGVATTASGEFSTAMGRGTTADAFAELALGQFNTVATTPNAFQWVATDRLFTIGNGTSPSANSTSDALVMLKNGNLGLGTSTPGSVLDVYSNNSSFGMLRLGNKATGSNEASISFRKGSDTTNGQLWVAGVGSWATGDSFVIGRNTPNVVVNSLGNVGIGTTTPATKLDVAGTVQATGLKLPASTLQTYTAVATNTLTATLTPTAQASFCALSKVQTTATDPGTNRWCDVYPNGDGTWTLSARTGATSTTSCAARCF